jgi:hypothetical protein
MLLDKLTTCRSLDVALLVPLSPEQHLLGRARMRLELARHGRISPDYWDGRDVNELRQTHAMLIDMIKHEHPETTTG